MPLFLEPPTAIAAADDDLLKTPPPKRLFGTSAANSPNVILKTPTLRSTIQPGPSDAATPPQASRSTRRRCLATEEREVPISPHVYDEAAMFLGEEEFFRQTTPARAR